MGSYGIGPARVAAAVVEQLADDAGIVWPKSIAPFDVHLVVLGKDPEGPSVVAANALYEELLESGVEVIYDDRAAGPGVKFADAELLGCPIRITFGARSLESGELELQIRRGQENKSILIEGAANASGRARRDRLSGRRWLASAVSNGSPASTGPAVPTSAPATTSRGALGRSRISLATRGAADPDLLCARMELTGRPRHHRKRRAVRLRRERLSRWAWRPGRRVSSAGSALCSIPSSIA